MRSSLGLGIAGGIVTFILAVGRVAGGIIMIIGGIFALLGAGLFGFLGLVLLVVGGGQAFREASISRQRQSAILGQTTSFQHMKIQYLLQREMA